jgi:hypothetical protein
MKRNLIIVLLIIVIIVLIFKSRRESNHSPIDNKVQEGMSNPDSFSYYPPEQFNRMDLIQKVIKGDGKAAFDLGYYYSKAELPEAAFYWFGISRKLGHEGISKDGLEFYEHNIIDKHMK